MFQLHRWLTTDDMTSRRSEFHLVNLTGKRALHEHHLSRKKCRLRKRQDIIDASWTVYEQETWNRFNEIVGNPDVIRQWNSMKWSRFTIIGFKTNSEIKIKLK